MQIEGGTKEKRIIEGEKCGKRDRRSIEKTGSDGEKEKWRE